MNNIIEKLYDLYCKENNVYENEDYQAAFEKVSKLIDDIKELLSEESRSMPDDLYSAMAKMMLVESREMFAGGFKTAMQIISECL